MDAYIYFYYIIFMGTCMLFILLDVYYMTIVMIYDIDKVSQL